MKNILNINEATKLAKDLQTQKKKIVLVGGCFDILHTGHIALLKKAKQKGDILFVLIESDRKIKDSKGDTRPVHNQKDRAEMIASIRYVDYVIVLPYLTNNQQYDNLIASLHPDIIATTVSDPEAIHKKRQAKQVGATLMYVTKKIPNISTTRLIEVLQKEL